MRRVLGLSVSLVLVIVLAVAAAVIPVPYVVEGPGPTFDTLGSIGGTPLIQIAGHKVYRGDKGNLNLVTVSISGGPGHQIGLFQAVRGWLDSSDNVVPEADVYPPGTTSKESQREGQLEMQNSQDSAVSAALETLDIAPKAIKIAGFVDGAESAKTLNVGDVILAVDGTQVKTLGQLTTLISGHHQVGDVLTFEIRRGSKTMTVKAPLMQAPDESRAILGIYPQPVWPFTVDFNLSDVGGPSAGMMFALGIIDLLTPGSLTGGKFIAGTGEISADGQVGPIGGIAQKMVGAHRDGAHYFLAPASNCPGVLKADVPKGLDVVKVATLSQALSDVKAIAAGHAAGLPHC